MGFELETLTGRDFAGLLIDGNAQGFIDGIAVLVEKSGECILGGNVLRPLCHGESSIEPRGSHTSRRRKRRSRSPLGCGAVFGGAICGCPAFFAWYNTVHRHSGIGFMTPESVHLGNATELTRKRSITLDAAFMAHPKRFKHVAPLPPEVPLAAWINPPRRKVPDPAQQSANAL